MSLSVRAELSSPTPSLDQKWMNLPEFSLQESQKTVNEQNYKIGDRIALFAELKGVNLDSGETLALSVPEGSSKIEEQGWYIDSSTQFNAGTLKFIVSPIQTGKLTLPALIIQKADGSNIARTHPFALEVLTPKGPTPAPPELIEPIAVKLPLRYQILFILLGIILTLGVIFGIRKFLDNRKKTQGVIVPSAPIDPDHILALKKIESLYTRYPFHLENLKPVAFGLSETLKEFFSKRFKIEATESTTDEMLHLLKRESISMDQLREIKSLFNDLDLLKFTTPEHYANLKEDHYQEIKLKAQMLIQRWAIATPSTKDGV